ncbi:putative transposase [uncultured Mediterranean phage uvMED]|nr:putative transposase [uncultured Mediterranean phage uvMED]BAQ87284.1 putative transposase [uncultured Mediterranean phage uvMED]BAQ87297.1 putative transposase [uncultured Mediterranean phage uvMED]BAQ87373.1 putative transposase [uncultured Mediterranean phage uvMED]
MTKANTQQQQKFKKAVVPMDEIKENATQIKHSHSRVTEAQADLVHMILHDGCNPTEAAERIGRNKSWAYNTLNKQHIIDYRKEISMRTLGWDAIQGLATMRELLNAKSSFVRLEASKDLMDRAGLRNDVPVSHSTAVQINFNVD